MKRFVTRFAIFSPYLFVLFYLIIGFLTPGYSHLQHTISRLSLGKFGYLESINILQFSIGLGVIIYLLRHHTKNSSTIKEVSRMLGLIAITLALLAIFPTDPINSFPKSIFILSWNSVVHFGLVIGFVLYAPVSIYRLYHAFFQDKNYSDLATFTIVSGGSTFLLSIMWFLFFYLGFLSEYRGLFQKIIVSIVLFWIIKIMNRIRSITLQS